MHITDSENLPAVDELDSLKKRATQMGIGFHPSIGLEKLREKVNAALTAPEPQEEPVALSPTQTKESVAEYRKRRAKEAGELVRIRVTCMNPAKREWSGEIFTAGNATVGTFKKYVPFGIDEGWHVPRIIFNMIMERRCQIFQNVPDGRGGKKRVGKLIPEFSVEVLQPLTPDELKALAQRQAMANGTSEE